MKKYFLPPIVTLFSRKLFIVLLNFMSVFFSLSEIRYMVHEILFGYSDMGANGMIILNSQFKNIVSVFLAIGMIMNSRRTILRINGTEMDKPQVRFCEISENHGFGIVTSGLFISIIIIILELPDFLFLSRGKEAFLYFVVLFMVLASVFISIHLIIAYFRFYILNPEKSQT